MMPSLLSSGVMVQDEMVVAVGNRQRTTLRLDHCFDLGSGLLVVVRDVIWIGHVSTPPALCSGAISRFGCLSNIPLQRGFHVAHRMPGACWREDTRSSS